ncbi:MAG TPA: GGDEF domain-containing protein [Rhizomicrobium sp.]|nr:GGDEF domain-containing protein [Rhizomicrobium sp.]
MAELTVSYDPAFKLLKTVIDRRRGPVYQQEREQALAKTALALMSECGVLPTPDNFELFYTYAAGSSPGLGKAMDTIVAARRPFTTAILDDLRSRCLSSARTTQAIDNASMGVTATLNAVMERLEAAGRDAEDYGRTLSRASGELGEDQSPAALRKFVDKLLAETQAMESRTKTLEKELQDSSQQVNRLKAQLDDVRKESLTDSLTGVANRKAFDTHFAAAISEARQSGEPVCLLMCDIDHFKRFNDNWGHQTGDRVLRLVAQGLSENLKGRDTVARFGGEEFAVILRQTSLDNAAALADLLRMYVESKKLVKKSTGDILGTITISVGVAALNEKDSAASLIQRADGCLYLAKNRGRNRVVSEDETSEAETDAA